MRFWNVFSLVLAGLLFASCAKNRPLGQSWPARVGSLKGFSKELEQLLRQTLEEANNEGARTLVADSRTLNEGQFPIHFVLLPSSSAADGLKIGHAELTAYECTITLGEELFSSLNEYLVSVLLHEVGHCAGLTHNPKAGEIMYRFAAPLHSYSANAVRAFFRQTADAVNLPQ